MNHLNRSSESKFKTILLNCCKAETNMLKVAIDNDFMPSVTGQPAYCNLLQAIASTIDVTLGWKPSASF